MEVIGPFVGEVSDGAGAVVGDDGEKFDEAFGFVEGCFLFTAGVFEEGAAGGGEFEEASGVFVEEFVALGE